MKFFALALLLSSINAFSQTIDTKIECQVVGMTHGMIFTISKDLKLTVATVGWGTTIHLENSPITTKNGTIELSEKLVIEGEEPMVKVITKNVVKISEASEQYELLIDKTPIGSEDGEIYFDGMILKGADSFEVGDETMVLDQIACYGDDGAVDF